MPFNMQAEGRPADRPQVLTPLFMGAPWAQRFGGSKSELGLQEWTAQIKYLSDIQGLTETQQVQFILGSLEGEAKREILAVEEAGRDTPKKIFDLLKGLYGDSTPVAVVRAQFFNCRQGPKQSIRAFSLQLREIFSRLKRRGGAELGDADALMRDQFLMGLRDGPIRQTLKAQSRRDPALTFEAARQEALALEDDRGGEDDVPSCMGVRNSEAAAATPLTMPTAPTVDWKHELRAEIMKDVKEQMAEMSKAILEELRAVRSMAPQPSRARAHSTGSWERRGSSSRPVQARFQWDDQGRPICGKCGTAGHIGRYCSAGRPSQEGF